MPEQTFLGEKIQLSSEYRELFRFLRKVPQLQGETEGQCKAMYKIFKLSTTVQGSAMNFGSAVRTMDEIN